ncbi:MAG: cell division protein FtsQ/DivIB [Actinomycetota bacterium]
MTRVPRVSFRLPRLMLLVSIGIVAGLAYLLGWSKAFVVEKIVIQTQSKEISREVKAKLAENPPVVNIGDPLARVDRRAIASRLRELLWVENIELDRLALAGEVRIAVIPREPIGRITTSTSATVDSVGFLGADLEIFYLPRSAVDKAIASGETNWGQIPEVSFQSAARETNESIRGDVKELIESLKSREFQVKEVRAQSPSELSTRALKSGKSLDIFWGSVNELPLKIEVLERLMALKENKRARYFNLSNPVSPIVK